MVAVILKVSSGSSSLIKTGTTIPVWPPSNQPIYSHGIAQSWAMPQSFPLKPKTSELEAATSRLVIPSPGRDPGWSNSILRLSGPPAFPDNIELNFTTCSPLPFLTGFIAGLIPASYSASVTHRLMNGSFAPDSHLLPLMTVLCDLSLLWTMTYIFQYLCRVIDAHGVYAAKTFFLVWKHGLCSIICPTACKTPDYVSSKKYRKPSWPIDFRGVDLFQCNVPTVLLIFRKRHKNIPRLLVSPKRTGVLSWSREELVAPSHF